MELLKQPLGRPFTMAEQVITLVAANAHVFSDLPVEKIKAFRLGLLDDFAKKHADILGTSGFVEGSGRRCEGCHYTGGE